MNTKPEAPELELVTPSSTDEAAPAKPVRRRRAPKAEAAAEATPAAAAVDEAKAPEASVAEAPVAEAPDAQAAEPAAAPKRRRRKAEPAPAVAEEAPADASPAPVATSTADASEAPAAPEVRSAPAEAAVPGDDGVAVATGDGDGEATAAPLAGDEQRRRRRNRRDRKRLARREGEGELASAGLEPAGEGAEGSEAGEADADDAGALPPRPVAVLPKDAGEVFAQVLSGGFDAEDAAEAPAAEEAPPKRVLQPDADAPKLQKVLAQSGVGSRRDMEALIVDGKITVNGEPAHVGQRISFGDRIQVNGKPVKVRITQPSPRVVCYHKPVGEIVTHDDPQQRPTVFRRLPRLPQGKWLSVGRLDINTEGLLLFTNSGELANQLMHPRFGVEREYAVRVLGTLDDIQREDLLEGVAVDGHDANFLSIEDGGGEGANHWYRVVIAEGRNREVRKMFEAVGLTVSRLIRIRYGQVVLPRGLKRGAWIDLDESDVRAIRRLAGGDRQQGAGQKQHPGPKHKRGPKQPGRPDARAQGGGQGPRQDRDRDRESGDHEFANIPNPLEQTFDRRAVQKQRPFGSGGGGGFSGGFGSKASQPKKGGGAGGPKQPDPMQTSVGYIGADGFHRRGNRGGGGGGGNRGGGGGGGLGGFGRGGRGR